MSFLAELPPVDSDLADRPTESQQLTCKECQQGARLNFDFTMAFQPIVNLQTQTVFAYEALVRGINGEPAASILAQVNDHNRYRFDQACRAKAIELAASLGLSTYLSINFLPNAIYSPETCIRATLQAAKTFGFPKERLIFEVTEGEKIEDHQHLSNIITEYKRLGFKTAIDDFGDGYAGLKLLGLFQPDIVKLDRQILCDIDQDPVKRSIVRGILQVCHDLNIQVIGEGIETPAEKRTLQTLGVHLMQGFLFARPLFQGLPTISEGSWTA